MFEPYLIICEKSLSILLQKIIERFDLGIQVIAGGGDNTNLDKANRLLGYFVNYKDASSNIRVVIDLNIFAAKSIAKFQSQNPSNLIVLDGDEQEDLYPERLIRDYFGHLGSEINYDRKIHKSFKSYLKANKLTNFTKLELANYIGERISQVEFLEFSRELYEIFFGKVEFELYSKDTVINDGSCISVGIFDGMHKGHLNLIEKNISVAKELSLDPIVITFDPHPRLVLKQQQSLDLISTLNQRVRSLISKGVKKVIVIHFTPEFASISTEVFVKMVLIKQFRMKYFVIGYDTTLGNQKNGDQQKIIELSKLYNFGISIASIIKNQEGEIISSTLLRKKLTSNVNQNSPKS